MRDIIKKHQGTLDIYKSYSDKQVTVKTMQGLMQDLLDDIKEYTDENIEPEKEFFVELHRIGGYELLGDGTQEEIFDTPQELYDMFCDEMDKILGNEKEPLDNEEIIENIGEIWSEMWNDGGGSGWIEDYTYNNINLYYFFKKMREEDK